MKKYIYIFLSLILIAIPSIIFINFTGLPIVTDSFVSWTNWRNLYRTTFREKKLSLRKRDYYLDDIDIYESTDNKKLYTGIWTKEYSELILNKTRSEFKEIIKEKKLDGLYLSDIDIYKHSTAGSSASNVKYSGVFKQNNTGVKIRYNFNMPRDTYYSTIESYSDEGFKLIDLEHRLINGEDRFFALFERHQYAPKYVWRTRDSYETFRLKFMKYKTNGYRPVDIETYKYNGQYVFTHIWKKDGKNINWRFTHNTSHSEFITLKEKMSGWNYRLIDIDNYLPANGHRRWNGIWYQNQSEDEMGDHKKWYEEYDVTSEIRKNDYVSYIDGDTPLLITVPHGGTVIPKDINLRTYCTGVPSFYCNIANSICGSGMNAHKSSADGEDGWSRGSDKYTKDYADALISAFKKKCNKTPFMVLGDIRRNYIDYNRITPDYYKDPEENNNICAYQDQDAFYYYDSYHNRIAHYIEKIEDKWGLKKAVMIDLHGANTGDYQLHFGLGIRGAGFDHSEHTMKNELLRSNPTPTSLEKKLNFLYHSTKGLQYFLQGFDIEVSPEEHEDSNTSLNGGATTRYFSNSLNHLGDEYHYEGPFIDVVQFEAHTNTRDGSEMASTYGKKVGKALCKTWKRLRNKYLK